MSWRVSAPPSVASDTGLCGRHLLADTGAVASLVIVTRGSVHGL